MKRTIIPFLAVLISSVTVNTYSQNRYKAVFISPKPGFYQNSILRDDREVKEKTVPAKTARFFVVDLSSASLPNKVDLYRQQWHNSLCIRMQWRSSLESFKVKTKVEYNPLNCWTAKIHNTEYQGHRILSKPIWQ